MDEVDVVIVVVSALYDNLKSMDMCGRRQSRR
jgi:hypothetical protein